MKKRKFLHDVAWQVPQLMSPTAHQGVYERTYLFNDLYGQAYFALMLIKGRMPQDVGRGDA